MGVWLPGLCFIANTAGSTISMAANGSAPTVSLETSTDGETWTTFTAGTTTVTLTNVGDKVYFRGNNTALATNANRYWKFTMTGSIAASGNIMSILDTTLAATSVSNFCFANMFKGCTSLTTAPALPATTLARYCYSYMFDGCTSLQVYSSSGTGHDKAWVVPTSGAATGSYTSQYYIFNGTTGDYASTQTFVLSTQQTFYTQNEPV